MPGTDPLGQWQFAEGWSSLSYIGAVVALAFVMRVASAFLKATQLSSTFRVWSKRFRYAFRETFCSSSDPRVSDYFHGFFVGLLQLLVFPVLIATGTQAYIGAWLGFKVVAQWKRWAEDRTSFNRFLILNALVLLFSYWLSARSIVVGVRFPIPA